MPITKVLIANRGEIAVRIIRTCRDLGIESVAIYAEPDRNALHVEMADEAYSLGGTTAAESYLRGDAVIALAERAGADAIHPGYGFLSENADFARAVIEAGIIWIGPPPQAIESLGDKVSARKLAQQAGAPLVPGTPDPVKNADDVLAFAQAHGLPVAIKAAFGGGGRGLKVARTLEEVPELFDSAVREAVAAFGRGECFVERFIDRPRHIETQCLADSHGNVAVISTRDCSLQRRHQKLVEEAPAPFLSGAQLTLLTEASTAILRTAGYVGAGTCEFLLGADGTISFLEVNTRLQVEHPVTEEVTGLDLVAEQIRIAEGEELGYDSVPVRGHSFEFRLNGEDPAMRFLPSPGTITRAAWPMGPGVRVDAGIRPPSIVSGAFDSMIAKLIVTGPNREMALGRARRALIELAIDGVKTTIPFHRAVLDHPSFTAVDAADFRIHTTWIETDFAPELARLPESPRVTHAPEDSGESETQRVVVEVGGKRLEVVLPAVIPLSRPGRPSSGPRPARRKRATGAPTAGASSSADLTAPMQGTVVKVNVEVGAEVTEGDVLVVLEAMKMEQPLAAHRSGTVTKVSAAAGETVSAGAVLVSIEE